MRAYGNLGFGDALLYTYAIYVAVLLNFTYYAHVEDLCLGIKIKIRLSYKSIYTLQN